MIKEKEVTQKIKVKQRFCDDCEGEINRKMFCSHASCEICQKDLCDKCVAKEFSTMGDYRTVYCKSCWTIYEPYIKLIEEKNNEIELLEKECLEKCLLAKNKIK